ncbi:MAG: glycosyltransferase family 4 protein [Chitinophagaceae bacterium]|nr:glycosyltransferase family 4 protein [Chitinophagaceae bacterium]
MPKILLGVSSSFCANFLRGQVAFLAGKGYEVVIVSGPGEEIEKLAKEEGGRLIPISFTKKISPFTDLVQLFKIIRILKIEKPDIINAGNPKSGFLIMLACYIFGSKKRIFTLHGLMSDNKTGLFKWLITLTEKISCAIAEKVIVVSHSLKKHAEQRGVLLHGKGVVIEKGSSNGIDTDRFSRNVSAMEASIVLKKKYGIADSDTVIGFIGRLTKDKGIDILFEAFNRLVVKYSNLKLLLVGPIIPENPFSPRYTAQLHNDKRIIFTGKMLNIVPAYIVADILVLPSFREGFPNVLIEAAAMETPVIASDIPGCVDALQKGYNGELFNKGNVEDLIVHLEKLIKDRDLRTVYGRNGRVFVEENFRQEKIWEQQELLYKNT